MVTLLPKKGFVFRLIWQQMVPRFHSVMSSKKKMQSTDTKPSQKKGDTKEQKSETMNDAVLNYRLTKKSALGMLYVALGSVFGR